ncbi:MAG: hypothetical protein DRI97_13825, partial [Bacteroidetes bacterium]
MACNDIVYLFVLHIKEGGQRIRIFFLLTKKPIAMVHRLSIALKASIALLILLLILIQPLKAQYIPPPTNFQTEVINSSAGVIFVSWDHDIDTNLSFQFYIVYREGLPMGTSTCNIFMDTHSDYGTYCYGVQAFYDQGYSAMVGPLCEDIVPVPEMETAPPWLEATVPLNTPNYYPDIWGILNEGGVNLSYEVIGFGGPTPPPGFITEVTYDSGTVMAGGGLVNSEVTWSSVGYTPGTYYQDLVIESDDPYNPVDLLTNIMHVGPLSFLIGDITDNFSQDSLLGVKVSGAGQQTQTDANGHFSFRVPINTTFELTLEKPGYETLSIPVTTGIQGSSLQLDTSMFLASTNLSWVHAETDCNDPAPAEVSWSVPGYTAELMYDDGGCDDYYAWEEIYGEHAVKYTPSSYPVHITGGSFYVGRGVYPVGNWLNSTVAILVYDEEEYNCGVPGNVLDSIVVTVANYEWVEFSGLDVEIESGSFFISVMQLDSMPDTPPIGIDNSIPYLSKSFSRRGGGQWRSAIYEHRNFMIRALVDYESDEQVAYYVVARVSDFDPVLGPASGTLTPLNNSTGHYYIDNGFQLLPDAWYAFAVQPMFNTGQIGDWVFSNIIGHDMGKIVDFIAEDCNGNPIDSLQIMMAGEDYPYALYTNPEPSYYGFDCVWIGYYSISVEKAGYSPYYFTANILSDTTFFILLDQSLYPPQNLWIDTITSTAYWDAPVDTSLLENYYVFLDGVLMDSTHNTRYQFDSLVFGQTYTACVLANYSCGNSSQVCEDFTSAFVDFGTQMPLSEDWLSGSFGSFWTAEDNWVINGQYGNPQPSAEFNWDPVMTNYESSLTSGLINGVFMDSTKQDYLDGQFILVFDLALTDNSSMSGTEFLMVELWREDEWIPLAEYSNVDGSFNWLSKSLDITDIAMGQVFNIRFRVAGENTTNIQSWFVDNIEIFHYCAPPTNLITELLNEVSIELTWSPPVIGSGGEWIMWDDGVNVDGIGLTGGGVFSVASKWDADMITQYDGQYITK